MTNMEVLIKALEAGGYNAKPSKLRQGSMSALFYDEKGNLREGTEEEWDKLYAQAEAGLTTGKCQRCEQETWIVEGYCLTCAMVLDAQKPADQRGSAGHCQPKPATNQD
jgi:hypothetical protein